MSGILFKLLAVKCYLLMLNNKIEISQKGSYLQNLINFSVPFLQTFPPKSAKVTQNVLLTFPNFS